MGKVSKISLHAPFEISECEYHLLIEDIIPGYIMLSQMWCQRGQCHCLDEVRENYIIMHNVSNIS